LQIKKFDYFRSKKHLKNVASLPCQNCSMDDGTVVAAHTNWGGGKARSLKASDEYTAALCYTCHSELDQGRMLTKEQRKKLWVVAHYRTVRKLVMLGMWPSEVPIPFVQEYEDIWNSIEH
jgi:hypothetical protein